MVIRNDGYDTHPKFQRDVRIAREAENVAARMYRSWGLTVVQKPLRIADRHEDWKDYIDDGDLFVNGYRVEVKRYFEHFTGLADWPARYDCLWFVEWRKWEAMDPKPVEFVVINQNMTHAGLLDLEAIGLLNPDTPEDERLYDLKEVWDAQMQRYKPEIVVDPGLLEFVTLPPAE